MAKQFTHKDLDHTCDCTWSYTSSSEEAIINAAVKHVLSCKKGFRYKEDSLLLRATLRALVQYSEYGEMYAAREEQSDKRL